MERSAGETKEANMSKRESACLYALTESTIRPAICSTAWLTLCSDPAPTKVAFGVCVEMAPLAPMLRVAVVLVPLPRSMTVVCSPVEVAEAVLFAAEVAFVAVLVAIREWLDELAKLDELELLDGRDEVLLLLLDQLEDGVHEDEEEREDDEEGGVQVFCSSWCQVVIGRRDEVEGGGVHSGVGSGVHDEVGAGAGSGSLFPPPPPPEPKSHDTRMIPVPRGSSDAKRPGVISAK